jgi:hypothetical protein
VRRGLDWTTCWRVSCHPFSRRRLGVMLESHGLQLHSLSSAPSTYLAKGHEARITVGCPLVRSAAWCPVGKKDNMVLRRSREVCSIFKYLTLLSAYWHNYLYHTNRGLRSVIAQSLRQRLTTIFLKQTFGSNPAMTFAQTAIMKTSTCYRPRTGGEIDDAQPRDGH